MRYLLLLWAVFAGLMSGTVMAGGLPPELRQALREARIPESSLSLWVQAVDSPQPRLSNAAYKRVQPASVMKLATTYAALDLLGPAYTYRTRLLTSGEPVNGVIDGPLWLQGNGDPRVRMEDVWLLLRQLRQQGIQRITGGLAIDNSIFNEPQLGAGAFDGQGYRAYNVEADAALLNFNVFQVQFRPVGNAVQVQLDPAWSGLQVDNQLQLGDGECGEWDDGVQVQVEGAGQQWRLHLSGSYPLACGLKSLPLNLLPHAVYDYALMQTLWQEMGGRLQGGWRLGRLPGDAVLLAEHESAPLAVLVRDINKFSSNIMARQLFLSLGAASGEAGNRHTSQAVLQQWLSQKQLDPSSWVFENGSGLSRLEQTSAAALGKLLLSAYNSPLFAEFESSLPIAAVDGTMKKRLNGEAIAGHAHIKTGYIMGVRSVAGYVFDRRGRRWAVVGIINDPRAIYGKGVLDTVLQWVYRG